MITGISRSLIAVLVIVHSAWFALTVVVAMTAVFDKDPARHQRALEVLRVLMPRWRGQSRDVEPRAPD
jgi:hypothetical protein